MVFDRRHSHRAPHILTYTSTNMTSLKKTHTQKKPPHAVMWAQNVGLNWQKSLDRANFYIYVPVYISTTLWPLGGIL